MQMQKEVHLTGKDLAQMARLRHKERVGDGFC
jgi:hypothetical protein